MPSAPPVFDRATFFAWARRAPFGGRLTQQQVDGLNAILDLWEAEHRGDDDRWLAYMLATAFHETGGTMAPVEENLNYTSAERIRAVWPSRFRTVADAQPYVRNPRALANFVYGGRLGNRVNSDDGWTFRGRGLPQLTGRRNYATMGEILNLPLVERPEMMRDLNVAVRVLFEGMLKKQSGFGDFTGKALDDYFNATTDDPEGARRVVNGTDKASLIARYHQNFLDSLTAAKEAALRAAPPQPAVVEAAQPDGPPLSTDRTTIGGVVAGLGGATAALGPVLQGVNNPWQFALLLVVALGVFLVVTGRVEIKRRAGA